MVNTEKVERDIYEEKMKEQTEKMSELEKQLKEYQEKEQAQKEEEEKQKELEIEERLKKFEEEKEAMQQSFEEKLEQISQRATTQNSGDAGEKLTREEYMKNREKYDTAALKEALPSVFNN